VQARGDRAVDLTAGGTPLTLHVELTGTGGPPLSALGRTTEEIARGLPGLNARALDVDVNADSAEDADDVVTNQNSLGP
jgi:hypothetical protein